MEGKTITKIENLHERGGGGEVIKQVKVFGYMVIKYVVWRAGSEGACQRGRGGKGSVA